MENTELNRGVSKIAEKSLELRGFNPRRREQVSRLRDDAHVGKLKSNCSEALASRVLRESIDSAESLHKKWSSIDLESQRLMQELSDAKVMLGKTLRLSTETNASMESVRWETRQVSSLEVCPSYEYFAMLRHFLSMSVFVFTFCNTGSNRYGYCGPRIDENTA
jgi:hypothetical protein